jgi:hypothetical protein
VGGIGVGGREVVVLLVVGQEEEAVEMILCC